MDQCGDIHGKVGLNIDTSCMDFDMAVEKLLQFQDLVFVVGRLVHYAQALRPIAH